MNATMQATLPNKLLNFLLNWRVVKRGQRNLPDVSREGPTDLAA